jgi:hypothetical protein
LTILVIQNTFCFTFSTCLGLKVLVIILINEA